MLKYASKKFEMSTLKQNEKGRLKIVISWKNGNVGLS